MRSRMIQTSATAIAKPIGMSWALAKPTMGNHAKAPPRIGTVDATVTHAPIDGGPGHPRDRDVNAAPTRSITLTEIIRRRYVPDRSTALASDACNSARIEVRRAK